MCTKKWQRSTLWYTVLTAILVGGSMNANGQFDAGSDGSDGVFAPVADMTIDMTDHPDGVYQYVSVNIPAGVTITFLPNADNTPVTWLVQTTCVMEGNVNLNGSAPPTNGSIDFQGGAGGPGGFEGGDGAPFDVDTDPGPGLGPGGAGISAGDDKRGGGGSYGTMGGGINSPTTYHPPGDTYGSIFLLPLIGGSGGSGGGRTQGAGGGGGGGAFFVAANESVTVNGTLSALGGNGANPSFNGRSGGGSGGAIRVASPNIFGTGTISALGGSGGDSGNSGGQGRIRLEGRLTEFTGTISGAATTAGGAGILMLPDNLQPDLTITSVAGMAAPANPTGDLASPDILLPITETNPMTIVVSCQDLLPDTIVTVFARPEFGAVTSATGAAMGTFDSSTATVSLTVPPGVGTLTAQAVNGVTAAKSTPEQRAALPKSVTGMAANGERFAQVEIEARLGSTSQLVLVTESGARIPLPNG